jgi:hypothetical protein
VSSSANAAFPETDSFVIRGLTRDGQRFRPSDWAERLCGVMSRFGSDGRMRYSPYVQPRHQDGVPCVIVDGRLNALEPLAYRFLVSFARENELQLSPGAPAD